MRGQQRPLQRDYHQLLHQAQLSCRAASSSSRQAPIAAQPGTHCPRPLCLHHCQSAHRGSSSCPCPCPCPRRRGLRHSPEPHSAVADAGQGHRGGGGGGAARPLHKEQRPERIRVCCRAGQQPCPACCSSRAWQSQGPEAHSPVRAPRGQQQLTGVPGQAEHCAPVAWPPTAAPLPLSQGLALLELPHCHPPTGIPHCQPAAWGGEAERCDRRCWG
jgi:hypothetical protein